MKLKSGSYLPGRPAGFTVPKGNGEDRTVSTFAIADEVISKRLYSSLMRKNSSRLSGHAYAYRYDRTPHDAISHIRAEFGREQRLFVAEYDFSSFFDKISHDFLWNAIADLGVITTPLERSLIAAFLTSYPPSLDTENQVNPKPRTQGLPQGTSISLFLANVAASQLDRSLERLGVGFARYADDTLIWSPNYEKVCDAAAALHSAADAIGSPINVAKSPGVRLLLPADAQTHEMSGTKRVDYLGHTLGLRSTQMKSTAVNRIKSRVQNLLFTNLLMEPLRGNQNLDRLTATDRDYATYIWQLRRYLYGPLSENQVRRFQRGSVPDMTFQGAMSFFPLVDHDSELETLDVWIATQTWLALKKRQKLLSSQTAKQPRMWGISLDELIRLQLPSDTTGQNVDLRIPSIRRIAGIIRTAVDTYGFGAAADGAQLYLYED
ncbi:hypothetical protein LRQ04_03335 [Paenarthrobacter sp. AR 02]|uniref:reverse transcriptase domain-containing protein n=1 Tax=Paenarthrobacter sp. AR 02 TaxID=2899821 RepID=UPI001EFF1981|nr:reverse transcriptase domain-containing protein [Paenarthrobacter sp. AR 02]MCF3138282.1 hypothetical protein [Paenarthrobacter sp. AR 02]